MEIHFGGARLNAGRRAVVDETGREVELRSKTYDVLVLLMQRADIVVSKDELFDHIWNGAAVSEDTLVQCITEIRKAIGPKGHEALKTITKVGYRLVPDAVSIQVVPDMPKPSPVHQRGIAVLPFLNLSGEPEQDFLSDGLAEDVITDLSNSSDLFVIARNSSFSFKGKTLDSRAIAQDLGVRYLIEGSVRKSGERLRISVQLVDAEQGGLQVWGARYDRPYDNVFDIQDDIAQQVTTAIVGKLAKRDEQRRQRPASMEVYELTLRSRELWMKSKTECDEALILLSRAVQLDSHYARAHSALALAHTYAWAFWMQAAEDHLDEALRLSARAVELDPHDAVVRGTYGYVLLYSKRWDEALRELDAAIEMNPNGAHVFAMKAHLLAMAGDGQRGLEFTRIAAKLNPHPPTWYNWQISVCYLVMQHYEDCIKVLRGPEFRRGASRRTLMVALVLSGQVEEARREAGYYMAYDPTFRASTWLNRLPYRDENLKRRHIAALVEAGVPE